MTGAVQFRIYTENKNRPEVEQAAAKVLDSFTSFTGTGFWKGSRENSLVLEYIGTGNCLGVIRELAEDIRAFNHQEAVLVTMQHIESEVI